MKVSELIGKLIRYLVLNGDIPVVIDSQLNGLKIIGVIHREDVGVKGPVVAIEAEDY